MFLLYSLCVIYFLLASFRQSSYIRLFFTSVTLFNFYLCSCTFYVFPSINHTFVIYFTLLFFIIFFSLYRIIVVAFSPPISLHFYWLFYSSFVSLFTVVVVIFVIYIFLPWVGHF